MKRPMLVSAVLEILVVAAAWYLRQPLLPMGFLLLVCSFLLCRKHVRGVWFVSIFAVLLTLLSVGRTFAQINRSTEAVGSDCSAEVTLLENPPTEIGDCQITARVEHSEVLPQGTNVLVTMSGQGLQMGDRLFVRLTPKELYPEYRISYYAESIYVAASVAEMQKIGQDRLLSVAGRIRRHITNRLFSNLRYESAATVSAVIIGDRSHLSEWFSGCIRAAGVSHVMVVSGMHLAIFMRGLFAVLNRFRYNRYVRAAVSFAAVILIMAVCGFTKSVIRAGITYIAGSCAEVLKRDSDPVNTLGFTVTVVLAATPLALFSISFQLSVLATFGILVLSPFFEELIGLERLENRFVKGLIGSVVCSLAAMIMTMPVVISNFGFVSVVAPLTNLFISYAVTAVIGLTVACILIGLLPFGSLVVASLYTVLDVITWYINLVIVRFGELPYATVSLPAATVPIAVIAIGLLGVVIWIYKRRSLSKADRSGSA